MVTIVISAVTIVGNLYGYQCISRYFLKVTRYRYRYLTEKVTRYRYNYFFQKVTRYNSVTFSLLFEVKIKTFCYLFDTKIEKLFTL